MNIQGVHALFNQPKAYDTPSTSGSTSSSSSSASSTDGLDANSFITLLTAQLQAQDPTDPMDPDQMVNELVSLNSLQQLIGIKQDLDTLTGNTTGSTASTDLVGAAQAQTALSPAYQQALIQQKISPALTSASF